MPKIKKTYVVAAVLGLLGVAEGLGYHVPEAVYVMLAAAGITTVRHAIAKTS